LPLLRGKDEQWHPFSLNSEPDLASIPMAGGRWRAGGALLRPGGLTLEVIAEPKEQLSVRSQIALLDEAAIALKDDYLGFRLARDFDPRNLGCFTTSWRLRRP